jgi:predicted aldo/keto reductase-like oxidoreductase
MYYNQAFTFEAKEKAAGVYTWALSGAFTDGIPGYASCCLECGECEEKCPQHLPIREHMRDVSEYFGR